MPDPRLSQEGHWVLVTIDPRFEPIRALAHNTATGERVEGVLEISPVFGVLSFTPMNLDDA